MYFLAIVLINGAFSSSSGSFAIDALGLCSELSSGAYNNSGYIFCPKGMHSVIPPVRTDAYTIRTGDGLLSNDPDEYIPDSIMEIHIRTHNRYMKYLGLMIYAVKAGAIPREGCSGGCDGKVEEKVGSWDIVDSVNFKTTYDEKILTHAQAKRRRFHHVLRFQTPPTGTGPIIFRAILKQGATNGGAFYWPMIDGDLQVNEGTSFSEAPPAITWVTGESSSSCSATCSSQGLKCNPDATSDVTAWDDVKYSTSCKLPLLSGCLDGASMSITSDGYCTFHAESECAASMNETQPDVCSGTNGAANPICPCASALVLETGLNGAEIAGITMLCIVFGCMSPILIWYFFCRGEDSVKVADKIGSFWSKEEGPKGTHLPPPTYEDTTGTHPPPPPKRRPQKFESTF